MSYVYMIQQGDDGPIKIGRARNLPQRVIELQVGSPHRLHLRAAFRGGRALELEMHEALSAYRLRGEWFHPTEEVVTWFLGSLPLDELSSDPTNRGGRPHSKRMDIEAATRIWLDSKYPSDSDAIEHMAGWTRRSAYRWLGPRGVRYGRPKGPRLA